jgi:hypothetical protein
MFPEEELLRFHFKEVTLGSLAFKIRRYAARLFFRRASCSCYLSYALDLVYD